VEILSCGRRFAQHRAPSPSLRSASGIHNPPLHYVQLRAWLTVHPRRCVKLTFAKFPNVFMKGSKTTVIFLGETILTRREMPPVTPVDVAWLRRKDNLRVLRAEFFALLTAMNEDEVSI
jgi:hypothetical protein